MFKKYAMNPYKTLYEFNKLSENEQAEFVWEYGEHIGNLSQGGISFSLYSTKNHFVEFALRENEIVKISAFTKGAHLDKYADRIDLAKLLS